MKTRTLKTTCLLAAATIATTGCETLTPEQNAGLFGSLGGAAAGGIASASGASTGEAIATGVAAGAVTYIIAKREATERQRRIAEERARAAYAAHQAALKKRKVRYIAVDTEKDNRTSPNAKKSVMIWDTQSQEVVGNNVYDVKSPPAVGATAKFDTYSAEYVGSGT
jgi:hypothetical protein